MTAPQTITLKSLLADFLDFVYPPQCQICRDNFVAEDANRWICRRCLKCLALTAQPLCPLCRRPLAELADGCINCRRRTAVKWLYPLGTYDQHFSHLVKAIKYSPKPQLATYLGKVLAGQLQQFAAVSEIEAVCEVPIHRSKQSRRGFNQSELIAGAVAEALALPFSPGQLVQSRSNRDQIGLTAAQRFDNVRGVFAISDDFLLAGKRVLLIDDVTTCGATLNAAARTLLAAGARSVAAATLAMAHEPGLEPESSHQYLTDVF